MEDELKGPQKAFNSRRREGQQSRLAAHMGLFGQQPLEASQICLNYILISVLFLEQG